MKVKADEVTFSTGKEVYANNGIIGLCEPDKHGWAVYEGYDGYIEHNWRDEKLTKEEKIELADYMITLWQRFKDATS